MEGGEGSGRVAAEAVASLNGGDDALEVSAVKQLRQLQKAVAQHEHLGKRRGMHSVEQEQDLPPDEGEGEKTFRCTDELTTDLLGDMKMSRA